VKHIGVNQITKKKKYENKPSKPIAGNIIKPKKT
jgi:hypothetical protein